MSKNLKNIGLVSGVTMVSRVFGLVRDSLTAAVFGTSALASAFVTAFQLPNLFRRLLGEGALTAAFVPTLNETLAKSRREGAFVLVNQVASWLLVVSAVLVSAAMLVLGRDAWIVAGGQAAHAEPATIERWRMAAQLAVILFPYLIFVCLAAAFSAALQTLGRFLEPALSPVWLNLSMIGMLGGAVWLWPGWEMEQMLWLCGGVLLGGFLQMVVPAWALTREGWRPRFDLRFSAEMRAIVLLMGPTVLSSAVYLINMTFSRFIGLSLNDAAVSLLNLAQRLMELPIGVFAIAVTTVVFPLISRYAAEKNFGAMGEAYRHGMRLILAVNIPAGVGLAILAEPVIRLLFQRGEFRAGDTLAMAPVLAVSAAGLPFLAFVNLALRAFYAEKDTKTPVRAAVLSVVVNLGLSFALMGPLSTVGLALAGNIAVVAQAWFLQVRLTRRRPELALSHFSGDLVKIVLASALMGAVVWATWWGWQRWVAQTTMTAAVGVVCAVALGIALYGWLAWVFKMDGREEIVALVRRKVHAPKA